MDIFALPSVLNFGNDTQPFPGNSISRPQGVQLIVENKHLPGPKTNYRSKIRLPTKSGTKEKKNGQSKSECRESFMRRWSAWIFHGNKNLATFAPIELEMAVPHHFLSWLPTLCAGRWCWWFLRLSHFQKFEPKMGPASFHIDHGFQKVVLVKNWKLLPPKVVVTKTLQKIVFIFFFPTKMNTKICYFCFVLLSPIPGSVAASN